MEQNKWVTFVNMTFNGHEQLMLEASDNKHHVFIRIVTQNRGEMLISMLPQDYLAFLSGANQAAEVLAPATVHQKDVPTAEHYISFNLPIIAPVDADDETIKNLALRDLSFRLNRGIEVPFEIYGHTVEGDDDDA